MGSFRSASDASVVAAIAADADAFEELFRRYRRAVLLYAARRCSNPADVDDVVAATFVAALEAAGRYDHRKGEVRAWLLGIAHNQLGLLRRAQRRQRDLASAVGGEPDLSEDAFGRLVEQISAAQEGKALREALTQLTEGEREALLLISREGLSSKEAAAVLGITSAALRVRIFRARRTMKALIPTAGTDFRGGLPFPKEVEK